MMLSANQIMRSGSGPKTRRIVAANAGVREIFEFNKSLSPRGGTSARMLMKPSKSGHISIKIYQDKNNNQSISRKELIYHGISQKELPNDNILNFDGRIHLKKQMHMCDWLAQTKRPAEICTMEYIPTVYDCKLTTDEGEKIMFIGVGDFKSELIEFSPNVLS